MNENGCGANSENIHLAHNKMQTNNLSYCIKHVSHENKQPTFTCINAIKLFHTR